MRSADNGDDNGNERGAALIFVSITMIMGLFFVALGVDVALLYNNRRQAQAAVDSAALGAAHNLYNDAAIIATVTDILQSSELDGVTVFELDTCSAEAVPSGFTKLAAADCISVTDRRDAIRVRVPDQEVQSAFGQVFGVDEFVFTAVSIAKIETAGQANVLPFWIPFSGAGYSCLKSGSSSVPDPICSGPSSGNFGYANFGTWGNPTMGTTVSCNGAGSNRMPPNTAMGLDHDLSLFGSTPHGTTQIIDNASCGTTLQPNAAETLTGNMNNKAGEAFFSGGPFVDGQGSRLTRHNELSWAQTTSIDGFILDDNPLWEFIGDLTGADVPDSCNKNQFVSAGVVGSDTHLPSAVVSHLASEAIGDKMIKLLERCIDHFGGTDWDDHGALATPEAPSGCIGPCDDPVFTSNTANDAGPELFDIQYSPRFGYVPRITIDNPSGSMPIDFIDLEPIFLQRLYGGNCGGSSCSIEFDPGIGYSSSGHGTKANAVTAFIIPDDMLPNGIGDGDAAYAIGGNRYVSVIG